jgi:hypothetical protein
MGKANYAGHVPPRAMPQPRPAGWDVHDELMKLVLQWENSARKQFECGDRTEDEMGRRLVEHGAMCYFNCAQAIRAALDEPLPPPLSSPPGR